jgi:hypothetical protein
VRRRRRRGAGRETGLGCVDVADAGDDALIEQGHPEGRLWRQRPQSGDDAVEVEVATHDVEPLQGQLQLAFDAAPGHESHEGRVETHRLEGAGDDDGDGEVGPTSPRLAARVAVPQPRHLEVGVQHEAARKADEQVLADGLDVGDVVAHDTVANAQARQAEGDDALADEGRQRRLDAVEGVALRHRRRRCRAHRHRPR